MDMHRRETIENGLRAGIFALIVFAPLAFASVEPWARAVLIVGITTLFGVWLLKEIWLTSETEIKRNRDEWQTLRSLGAAKRFLGRHPLIARWVQKAKHFEFPQDASYVYRLQNFHYILRRRIARSGVEFFWIILCAFIFFQMLPIPPSAMKIISPSTYALYEKTLPGYGTGEIIWEPVLQESKKEQLSIPVSTDELWRETESPSAEKSAPTEQTLRFRDWKPLSIYPAATMREGLLFGSFALAFFLCTQLFTSSRAVRRALQVMIGTGFITAVIAIVQRISHADLMYGLREVKVYPWQFKSFMGPFINANNFCAFLELLFPIVLGLAITVFYPPTEKIFKNNSETPSIVRKRRRRSELTLNDYAQFVCLLFIAVIMLTAIWMAQSRGGILVSGLALALFVLFIYYLQRGTAPSIAILILILALSIGGVFYLGWGESIAREASNIDITQLGAEGRVDLWSDIWGAIKKFPVLGAGWGTFKYAYPVERARPGEQSIAEHAESDLIEFTLEGGFFALFILMLLFFSVLSKGTQMLSALGVGLLTGILSVSIHMLIDFPLHIPAIGFYFVLCLALYINKSRIQSDDR